MIESFVGLRGADTVSGQVMFLMIVVRHAAVAEKGLRDLRAVNGKWLMFGAVGTQPAAVLETVFILERLVLIPDPAISCVASVERNGFIGMGNGVATP